MRLSYFRSITYIDYYENGSKCGNIGHVRWEIRDEECKISIHVQGSLFDRIYKQAERRRDKLSITVGFLLKDIKNGYESRKVALMETRGAINHTHQGIERARLEVEMRWNLVCRLT